MFTIFQYPFLQNALVAGTFVAVAAALLGYFLVIRGLTFAGHALSNIGFAGAAGAVLVGGEPVYGLLAFTVAAALAIGILGREIRERDVAIGVMMTFALGLGVLFLSLYHGFAERAYSILFGTILGISRGDVWVTGLFCLAIVAGTLILWRPLLFSSFDPQIAEARGVPLRWIGTLFLVIVALAVSVAMQVVGVLLVFALLVGPPATAARLVRRPGRTVGLAVLLGVAYTWLGIWLAASGTWPVSFFIAAISFGVYLPVRLLSHRLALPSSRAGKPAFRDVGEAKQETARMEDSHG